jgi:hypothetical protein
MSFASCLARLQSEGALDPARAARFADEFTRLSQIHRKTMGQIEADALAGAETLDALKFEAMQRRRAKLQDIKVKKAILSGLDAHVDGGGKAGQYALAVMDHHEAVPGVEALDNRRASLHNLFWARAEGFFDRFSQDILGRINDRAGLEDVFRALRGEAVDNANARDIAAALSDGFEWLRSLHTAAGGTIGKLKNWAPQTHDPVLVAGDGSPAARAAWKADILPRLDPAAMIDSKTNRPFTPESLDAVLDDVWSGIVSQGLDSAVPGARGGMAINQRRADHRFLVFKSADDWLAYNDRFGAGDLMTAITGHVDSMTRDIAAMQILGPDPAHTVRWLGDMLRKDALPSGTAERPRAIEKEAAKAAREIGRMYDFYTGELTAIDPANRRTARFFSALRNWNVAGKLGGAFISAIATDPVFLSYAAKFNGLSATRVLADYVRLMNPADPGHRAMARHAGLIMSEMAVRTETLWRESMGGLNVHEMTRRAATGVLSATLLTPHTVAAKQAIGLGFMRDWADSAGQAFGALPEAKRRSFERYGISAAEWEAIRTTPLLKQDGAALLRPHDVMAHVGGEAGLKLALKLNQAIDSETRFAVPGNSLRAQTMLALGGRGSFFERGTIAGELAQSATQFKTYSIIAIVTHWQRALYGRGGMSRASYAATLPVLLTLGGAAAISMKAIADGQNPPVFDDSKEGAVNWGRAMVQGGGMGILGDFIQSGVGGQSRSGGTLAGFLAGPTISGVIDPAINLTLANAGQAVDGKDTNFAREALAVGKGLIPGGNAWYARLAINRFVLDEMQAIADPDYRKAWARMEKRAEDAGGGYYFGPGDDLAEATAPDLGNVLGNDADAIVQ